MDCSPGSQVPGVLWVHIEKHLVVPLWPQGAAHRLSRMHHMAPFHSSLSFVCVFNWAIFYLKIQNERKDGEVPLCDPPLHTVSPPPSTLGAPFFQCPSGALDAQGNR